ncbi:MAG: DUF1802 family protein [Leptolyngbya sp.]|nr:DUF1802 family protein [Leptolyngbya sp.]
MVAWALKEWDAAVTALLQGQTILLLRKGGLREQQGQFSVVARQVLLMPTFEHQKPELIKPEFQALVTPAPTEDKPAAVTFSGWADITHEFTLPSTAAALDLVPDLIWTSQFIQERLQWQSDRPLYGLLLRAYRFSNPVSLPWHNGYRGCRSWVELGQDIAVENSTPALTTTDYQHRVDRILADLPEGSAPR